MILTFFQPLFFRICLYSVVFKRFGWLGSSCSDIELLGRVGGGGSGPVGGQITSYSGGAESSPNNIALNSFVKINY